EEHTAKGPSATQSAAVSRRVGVAYDESKANTSPLRTERTTTREQDYSTDISPGDAADLQPDPYVIRALFRPWRIQDRSNRLFTGEQLSMRDTLHQAFNHPSSATTQELRSFITCRWDAVAFMRGNFDAGHPVSKVVTLTGTAMNAQAAICSDYVSQFWPNGGPFLLQAIDKLIVSTEFPVELQYRGLRLKITGTTSDSVSETTVWIHMTGSLDLQLEVTETLCWLAATLRTTCIAAVSKSIVHVEHLSDDSPGDESELPTRRIRLSLDPLEPLSDSDKCWIPMFTNSILTPQFPTRSRNDGFGLDIPPEMMASLAGVVMAAEMQEGLILKGLSTALVPIKECDDGTAIQWHFFHTNDAGGFLDMIDPASGTPVKVLKVMKLSDLFEKRAYLGWCKHAKILLGTQESVYNAISWSAQSEAGNRPRLVLSGFSLGLSSNGLGFFGPSATINFTLAKGQRTRFMNIEQQLTDRLHMAVKKPSLIFDTSTRRGWLLPTTSLLLHMVHLRARELGQDVSPTDTVLPSFKSSSGDGSFGAYEVLMAHLQPFSETSWTDTLALFCTALDMALQDVTEMTKSISRYDYTQIYGYELLDIVRAENPFRFSQKTIEKCSGGWAPIAQQVGYVLFCSELGNAIIPDNGGNSLCANWTRVPSGQDFLAASTPCMIGLMERQGLKTELLRLSHNSEKLDFLYQECKHKDSERCSHIRTYSSLCESSKKTAVSTQTRLDSIETPRTKHDGAVIIGKTTKLLKRALPTADNSAATEEDEEQKTSRHLPRFLHKFK
ncbi:MAG: hypothetical protein Q9205_003470, partial [Flavoplaca limonia]